MTTPSALSAALQTAFVDRVSSHPFELTIASDLLIGAIIGIGLMTLLVLYVAWPKAADLRSPRSWAKVRACLPPVASAAIVFILLGAAYLKISSNWARDKADVLATAVEHGHMGVELVTDPDTSPDSVVVAVVVVTDTISSASTSIVLGRPAQISAAIRTVFLTPAQAELADKIIKNETGGRMALTVSSLGANPAAPRQVVWF